MQLNARMNGARLTAAALMTAFFLSACGGSGGSVGDNGPAPAAGDAVSEAGVSPQLLARFDPVVAEAERDAAADATLRFGVSMYGAVADGADEHENVVLSPLSIVAAFGMLLPGTIDQAADEVVQALQLQGADVPHEAIAGLLQAMRDRNATDGITLSIANRSFAQKGWPIHADYVETLARWFGDAMATVDFAGDPEGGREIVNDWVASQTNDLIEELMPAGSIDGLTRLVLVNALYLLADWHEAFDAEQTRTESFTRHDGSATQVEMMHSFRELPVAQGPGYGAFELAYAGEELGLLVVVPDDWNSFEAALNTELLSDIMGGLSTVNAEIGLPRLETRSSMSLIKVLQSLGVDRIFEPGGWLAGIADDQDLHVNAVQHETYMRMDEEGTEAAAATGIGAGVTSAPSHPRIVADRPYLIVLRDRTTGGVLFLGRILDPVNN